MREKLKLTIDGRDGSISVESFLSIVRSSHALLKGFSGSKDEWKIGDVRRVNPLNFEFEGDYEGASQTIACVMDGLSKLEHGHDLPEYYDDRARRRISDISKKLRNGIASVSYSWGDRKPITFSKSFYSYERDVGLVEPYSVLAEIEGVLETLDTHAGHSEFYIYDRINGHGTECKFSDIPIDEVKEHYGHRVRVFGNVKYDKYNKPRTVAVVRLRPIEKRATIEDIHKAGFKLDSDLSSSEVIKSIRSLDV